MIPATFSNRQAILSSTHGGECPRRDPDGWTVGVESAFVWDRVRSTATVTLECVRVLASNYKFRTKLSGQELEDAALSGLIVSSTTIDGCAARCEHGDTTTASSSKPGELLKGRTRLILVSATLRPTA